MAVEDKFSDALVEAGLKGNPGLVAGGKNLSVIFSLEVAAADDDGSVYRIARLPSNAIPTKIEIFNDAIAVGTDYDLGLYDEELGKNGKVVDKEVFASALDMSAAAAITAPKNGLTDLGVSVAGNPVGNLGKKLWELLGLSKPGVQAYDLALTANTVGTAAGTISGRIEYITG